jgi:hypothetical protein
MSYSRKSEGMCQYVYGTSDWVVPLNEFVSDAVLDKVQDLIRQKEQIWAHLAKRIPEIQDAAYGPANALKGILEDRKALRRKFITRT